MKTKIAMLISTAGVLVAGSAAALVNTQVLGGNTPSSALVIDATPSSVTATTASSVPTVTTPSGGTATVVTVTPVGSATQASFAIGNAGTVVLDTAGDVLTIVGVNPEPGWTVTKSEREDATNVEIKLQAGNAEVEFHANLLFGVVNTSVELHDDSVTNSSTENTTNPSTDNTTNTSTDNTTDDTVDDHGGDRGSDDDNSGHGGGGDDSSGHGGGDDD